MGGLGSDMNSKQIDLAMEHRVPVMYEGRRYERIIKYSSWYDFRGLKPIRRLSVTLLDGRASVEVLANKVSLEKCI